MARKSKTWGYILEMPGRPPVEKQRIALGALGVNLGANGAAFHEVIAKGSTRPQAQLEQRLALLSAVRSGDVVVVSAPLCLGVSGKDADWFLGELQARGISVVVNGDLERIGPGDDRAAMVDRVSRQQRVRHVQASRRRASD